MLGREQGIHQDLHLRRDPVSDQGNAEGVGARWPPAATHRDPSRCLHLHSHRICILFTYFAWCILKMDIEVTGKFSWRKNMQISNARKQNNKFSTKTNEIKLLYTLLAISFVMVISPASSVAQAWRNCVQNSIGSGGCESIGPGGGRSIGPGGGMSIGPGGGLSIGPGGGQSIGPGGGQSIGPGGGQSLTRDNSRGLDTDALSNGYIAYSR